MDAAARHAHVVALITSGVIPNVHGTEEEIDKLVYARDGRIRFAIDNITKQVRILVANHTAAASSLDLLRGVLTEGEGDVVARALAATEPDHAKVLGERTRQLLGPGMIEAITEALK